MAENKGYPYRLGTKIYMALHLYGKAARHEAEHPAPLGGLTAVRELLRRAPRLSVEEKQKVMARTARRKASGFFWAGTEETMSKARDRYLKLRDEYRGYDDMGNTVAKRDWDSPIPTPAS